MWKEFKYIIRINKFIIDLIYVLHNKDHPYLFSKKNYIYCYQFNFVVVVNFFFGKIANLPYKKRKQIWNTQNFESYFYLKQKS